MEEKKWPNPNPFPKTKPNEKGRYLVFTDNSCIGGTVKQWQAMLFDGENFWDDSWSGKIQFWLPMPPNPMF